MGKFQREGGFGRGRSFGASNRGFNNRGSARPTMYKTICSKCGKECEVPFKPTGEKPVFCRDCFRENGGDPRKQDNRNFSRPNLENRPVQNAVSAEEFAALSSKVDRILNILTSAISKEEQQVEEEPIVEKKKRPSKKSV